MDFDICAISNLAVNAGERIMEVYDDEDNSGWTMLKPDCTPVTMADIESQMVIWAELSEMYPGVPVVSEEGQVPDFMIFSYASKRAQGQINSQSPSDPLFSILQAAGTGLSVRLKPQI